MDVFESNSAAQDGDGLHPLDQRLQPTPDHGTLDAGPNAAPMTSACPSNTRRKPLSTLRVLHAGAMIVGIAVALLSSSGRGIGAVREKFSSSFSVPKNPDISSILPSDRDLDGQKPQEQAEILLERAVARSDGATSQIQSRIAGWRGKLTWDSRLGQITTAALNSNDKNVRDSAVEVQLVAYGLTKSQFTVDALVRQADSHNHARKIWALWNLGLLANRGIETDRVVQVLTAHLQDSDRGSDNSSFGKSSLGNPAEDARQWAIEGLALVGTTSTIAPLLAAMHNDPSPMVRERAACTLAESGMLSHDQRQIAVPQLIHYSDDPALDAQTRAWAFQALSDITQQHLPNDSAAWRNWYQHNSANH